MQKRYVNSIVTASLFGAVVIASLTGCTPDDIFAPDDVTAPATPEQVLEDLREAYETMSIEAYARLLHPDYRFIFKAPGKAPFTREDDLVSTGRMFSGVDQKNSAGGDAPAVARIEFTHLEVLGGWERVVVDEVDWSDAPDVMRARVSYRFVLHLKRGGRLCAGGDQIVYAAPVAAGNWDGSSYWRWQLLGQRDL
jgi:hypothetical protein